MASVIWIDMECQHLHIEDFLCMNCGADLNPACCFCGQRALPEMGVCRGCYESPDTFTYEDEEIR